MRNADAAPMYRPTHERHTYTLLRLGVMVL